MSDDDLPVLTHVLRTGAGQHAPLWRPSLPEFDDAFDFRPIEYALTLRQYVADTGPLAQAARPPADAAVDPPVVREADAAATAGEPALDAPTIRVVPPDDAVDASERPRGTDGAETIRPEDQRPEPIFAETREPDETRVAAARDDGAFAEPRHDDRHATDVANGPSDVRQQQAETPGPEGAQGTSSSDETTSGLDHQHDARPPVVPEIVADPRRLGGRDAFVLPQDTDVGRASNDAADSATSLDSPPLALESNDPGLEPAGHDTPLHFPLRSLAERVRVAVYDDLSSRIRTELDARIAQAMHIEVENALAQMQDRLRVQLTDALRDVVGRAVDEEIARIEWSAATRETPP